MIPGSGRCALSISVGVREGGSKLERDKVRERVRQAEGGREIELERERDSIGERTRDILGGRGRKSDEGKEKIDVMCK